MEMHQQVVIQLGAADESPAFPRTTVNKASGWVNFGEKNLFPQEFLRTCSKSPVNASITDSTVTYICGKGAVASTKALGGFVGAPNTGESWDDLIERVARDYKTFGGFYWQVVVNKGGTTVSLFHQDYSTVRIGQIDEKGHPLTFRIAHDWTKTSGKYKPLELGVWPGIDRAKKGEAYLYHYWDYTPGVLFYSVPSHYSAIDYIRADGALGIFYVNSIDNGFTPSVILRMASNPDEVVKEKFQRAIEAAFSGTRGAGKAVIVWGESAEVKSSIEPFNASANADVYNNVEAKVFQKIASAHRLSSPTLAGVSGSGNLSGNAAEIIDSFILFNYTVVEKYRAKILQHLNKFTSINGTAALVIEDADVIKRINESKNPASTLNINNGNAPADTEILASKLGMGGTQALTAIMEGGLPEGQKKGLLTALFGFTDTDLNLLFPSR